MGSLDGKKALVTGASRGIGAAIARRLASEGAAVVLTYERSADAAEAVVDDITREGGRAVAVRMSAGDTASVRQAVDDAASTLGGLDILVNNAGVLRGGPIEQVSDDDIDVTLDVNVRGVMVATLAALPHLGAGGRIISTGSNLATRVPDPGASLYAASKAALIGWTQGLARDLGPRGITVNLVHPGSTDTDMNPADGPNARARVQKTALGRFGRPEEVAAMVAFLAGPDAAQITGAGFLVDGGANA
ncbi:3-oxoacyl-ACP reductase FabG [Mycolicibacterium sp. 018/SC-01/001]|uniref:SDR family NAD(P)-dependent oxidoreductase n=1 Tax=Mycolicibacterium sp. 018/SC-01/001 TaxID=2592069 RepID=UPI001180D8D9|nr:3-oxoacyl-ACP reductase family protein [Mycolicibacterium sp. 018/SC-01/001]TRW81758.1 3-oxoacyl-ACP reductase FabG [Mycolicibacterium sp. 018/SC-01/001]